MNTYANDHEQWEAIKNWWKANGKMIVVVVVLTAACVFGFRYWHDHQLARAEQASVIYDQMLSVQELGLSNQAIDRLANQLVTNYTTTPYASLAALLQAKTAVEKNDLKTAQQKLIWVMDNTKSSSLRQIARLRIARVLLAQNQANAAMTMLAQVDDQVYLPVIDLVKGDIFWAQGKLTQARSAYQAALQGLPLDEPIRSFIEMKIGQLSPKSSQ